MSEFERAALRELREIRELLTDESRDIRALLTELLAEIKDRPRGES